MWWSKLLGVLIAPVMLVTACGFTPVYAPGLSGVDVQAHYAQIAIDNIPDRSGQYLRNALIDRLYRQGRPTNPRYRLQMVGLNESITSLGVRKDATATRAQMDIRVKMILLDRQNGVRVLERSLAGSGGYNILDNQYATLVTEQSVRDQILDDIADSVQTTLNLYFLRAK